MKKLALAAITAALVAAGLYLQFERRRESESARKVSSPAQDGVSANLPTGAVLSIVPGANRTPVRKVEAKPISPLMKEYSKAGDYKALYDRLRAMDPRTAEETYVLAKLLEQCAKHTDVKDGTASQRSKVDRAVWRERFLATVSETDPNRDRRIAAFDEVSVDRCGRLFDVATTQKDVRGLFEKAAAAGDVRARAKLVELAMRDGMTGPDGSVHIPTRPPAFSDAQVETLRQAMQSGDPYAVIATVSAMNVWPGMVTLPADGGERSVDIAALSLASALVACDLGLDCGPHAREMLNGCAFQGNCDATDYRDYLFFYSMPPATAQRAGAYQAGIHRAIQGDWSYFTFHRGPPAAPAPPLR